MKKVNLRSIREVPIDSIHLHPMASIIPDMRPDEWKDFYLDIATHDIKVPIEVTGDGTIVDGRHRYKAAKELGKKKVPVIDAPLNGEDPATYMIKAAVLRRHLTDDQRSTLAVRWARENKQEPKPPIHTGPGRGNQENQSIENGNAPHGAEPFIEHKEAPTRTEATQLFKVGRRDFDKASKVLSTNPDLFNKVHKGEIALNNAYRSVKMVEQKQIIADTRLPTGIWQVIVIDPPWPYTSRQNDPTHEIASPYENMTIDQLKAMTIPCAPDSILWLWTTNVFLHEAFHLLESWGFTYRTTLTWAKQGPGLGDWLAGQTEHCLMATKGEYKVFRNNESTLLTAPRLAHSEKPAEFYTMIGNLCPGTKLDMFARKQRENWDVWGAEAK